MTQIRKDQIRIGGFLRSSIIVFFATCPLFTVRAAEVFSRQSQWEATVEAAKKEGKVNIYMYRYGKVLDVFRNDYPEIRPYLLTGTGAQINTKILAERRAGKYLADVIGLGSSNYRILHQQAKILDPIQPALMLPEVLDVSRWYGGKHRYLDPDGKFVFAYMANASGGQLYYNTDWSIPRSSTRTMIYSLSNGRAKSSRWIPGRERKSAPPCSSFIITRSSARRLSVGSLVTETSPSAATHDR